MKCIGTGRDKDCFWRTRIESEVLVTERLGMCQSPCERQRPSSCDMYFSGMLFQRYFLRLFNQIWETLIRWNEMACSDREKCWQVLATLSKLESFSLDAWSRRFGHPTSETGVCVVQWNPFADNPFSCKWVMIDSTASATKYSPHLTDVLLYSSQGDF